MAGQPATREKLKNAQSSVAEYELRLQHIRIALAAAGLDPSRFDDKAPSPAALMLDYDQALPMRVLRLAGEGQSMEEIREALGFTEAQQKQWADSYVDFAGACSRARSREEAFWLQQMRLAANSGDRTSVASIQSLISKRFQEGTSLGNAADLVHVHIGSRLAQPDEGKS